MTMSENTSVSEMAYNMEHELAIAINALNRISKMDWSIGFAVDAANKTLKELGND